MYTDCDKRVERARMRIGTSVLTILVMVTSKQIAMSALRTTRNMGGVVHIGIVMMLVMVAGILVAVHFAVVTRKRDNTSLMVIRCTVTCASQYLGLGSTVHVLILCTHGGRALEIMILASLVLFTC